MKRGSYLVLVRDGDNADAAVLARARAADGWTTVLDAPDILVRLDGVAGRNLDGAWILGTFHGGVSAATDAKPSVLQRICEGGWGAYVALVRDRQDCRLLRDPSGRMPCLTARIGGWRVFTSELAHFRIIEPTSPRIAWGALEDILRAPRIRDGRTAIDGVAELLPGQAMNAMGDVQTIWSPATFAATSFQTIAEARRELRAAVVNCVDSWASESERILLLLSGGLDSSVVLACLAEVGRSAKVRCLNYTRGAGSELNEERYARDITARAGVEMETRQFEPRSVDLTRAEAFTEGARPSGYAFSIENDDFECTSAEVWNADVCFSAAGGDGLFYQLRAPVYCADYLRLRGLLPGLVTVAYDSAKLTRASFWQVLNKGFEYAWRRRFDPTSSEANPYLADGVGAGSAGWIDRHPWFDGEKALCPGKRLHVWALLDCLNLFYDYGRASIAQTILPLVSQPIIETVLRTPSFWLSRGGVDRTLLREAFADALPTSIVQRTGKGAMDGYYYELFAANATGVRDALLGGVLASHGLLNRARIERDMPRRGEPVDGVEAHLLILYAAERWARTH